MKLLDSYCSYDEFDSVFSVYKDKNYVDYFIKDCKTLALINAKLPNGKMVTASAKIKYYYIKYCCVHGGSHKKNIILLTNVSPRKYIYTYFILYYLVTML